MTINGDSLEYLGVSAAEEAAYELLVDRSTATAAELGPWWHRTEELQSVLAALAAKGMASLVSGEQDRYTAVAPDAAIKPLLLAADARMRVVHSEVVQLAEEYRSHSARRTESAPIELVVGLQAVQQRVIQVQRGARAELRCFDKPPYLNQHGTYATDLEMLAGGVAARTIYERDSMGQPGVVRGIEALMDAGLQARVVPSLPMKMYLADNQLGILPVQACAGIGQTAMVVHESKLLDAIGQLFEVLWERALPLRPPMPRASNAERDSRQLLGLLLAGLTDESIARQLGVSRRTAERRIAALCASLGARTRFQAGVQAALRASPARPRS